jgi:hypothetical protein
MLNTSGINTINMLRKVKPTLKIFYQPDADIIFTISRLIRHLQALKVSVIFKHVKGHQDKVEVY